MKSMVFFKLPSCIIDMVTLNECRFFRFDLKKAMHWKWTQQEGENLKKDLTAY